ncbi:MULTISPECIES: cytidylyltransferase domain-containing protein [Clostridium]|uniref:cytidylyltransferase domain-containing protein n=1 Tax=Clostridium TaxID=1485 RepID=UPI0004D4EB83|nr:MULTISPECIES: glycosyltransferase family protein [Clostridium]KEH88686.1 acylneuraminate cytidylyltransferase [Clostridium novyi A str. 4540]KEH94308.1 acylneuraminate cytidylyltransferase [Clostridium botulinum C/D str. It1]KEH95006.1 acylneuraminate cytidylyltransferase [Clostridium novyi A str. GD211209]
MKVVCIMQARTGSTRLPGKVLKKICGKTVLEHDIDRIKRIENIDEIIIATTDKKQDDLIVNEALRLGVKYFRGSEKDVLSRYYYAAKGSTADVIMRVTSDCPLIDSEVSEDILKYYLNNIKYYDYVSNTIERTYPRGLDVEVFSFEALERAFVEAKSNSDREHVTPYIWSNPNDFKIGQYINEKDYSHLRWTLDTEEDFQLINKIYEQLYYKLGNDFYMKDILKLYETHKDLYDINKDIVQKYI